jgi:acetyl esterase
MRPLVRFLIPFMLSSQLFSAPVRRDIEYGRVGNTPLLLDSAVPEGTGPFPAVIIVHGGGWIGGNREYSVRPLFEPLTKAGFAWFSISYRLATDLLAIGVAADDVQAAINHIRSHAGDYNIDPARIAVLGESAGAHLAMLAVERSPKSVAAVVAMYAPSDLVSLARETRTIPESLRQLVRAVGMENFILGYLREISPSEHITRDLPPVLLIHGTADGIVPFEQSERLLTKLRDSGIEAELMTVDGGGHGLRGWELSPRLLTYRDKMITWLANRLSLSVATTGTAY